MFNRIVPIAAVAAIFLTGCGETAQETTSDAADARMEAGKNNATARTDAADQTNAAARIDSDGEITRSNDGLTDTSKTYSRPDSEAQVKLGSAEAVAMSKRAEFEFNIAMTTAEETYGIESQKCQLLLGSAEQTECAGNAEANLATASAEAAAQRDAAMVAADYPE